MADSSSILSVFILRKDLTFRDVVKNIYNFLMSRKSLAELWTSKIDCWLQYLILKKKLNLNIHCHWIFCFLILKKFVSKMFSFVNYGVGCDLKLILPSLIFEIISALQWTPSFETSRLLTLRIFIYTKLLQPKTQDSLLNNRWGMNLNLGIIQFRVTGPFHKMTASDVPTPPSPPLWGLRALSSWKVQISIMVSALFNLLVKKNLSPCERSKWAKRNLRSE